jgi:hypothetical protein
VDAGELPKWLSDSAIDQLFFDRIEVSVASFPLDFEYLLNFL